MAIHKKRLSEKYRLRWNYGWKLQGITAFQFQARQCMQDNTGSAAETGYRGQRKKHLSTFTGGTAPRPLQNSVKAAIDLSA